MVTLANGPFARNSTTVMRLEACAPIGGPVREKGSRIVWL